MTDPLKAELIGDTQLLVTRRFAAPPQRVFDAHFQPELVKQWMLGPPGWTMPVCEIAPVVGSKINIQWASDDESQKFGFTGIVKELDVPHRSVHTERFDFPGATETVIETLFKADGQGTLLEVLLTYVSKEAREVAMSQGMADGMESSYARIDAMLGFASS